VFVDWDPTLAPPPAWTPSAESVSATNIGKLMAELNIESYAGFHSWSTQEREAFWKLIIGKLGIQFRKECSQIMDLPRGPEFPQWLPGSELNIADSCFLAPNDTTAIVYREMDDDLSRMTYGELDLATNRVANSLVKAEFTPGDAIACYMPMTVESVIIYLGIVKAGCVVVSIADSFAPDEIDKRLRLSNAKGIFTQDFILRGEKRLPLYEKVVSADGPKAIVVPSDGTASVDLREEDVWWNEFLVDDDQFTAVARDPRDHTNILFSSGTTGDPKAIPWTQTTPIKCAADGYLHHNIQPGDVVAWPTNLGWMMGPWLIYASLMNQATIALYYGIPTGKGFAKFVQDAEVTMLGVVPSLVKAWRNGNCIDGLNWSSINAFSSTGECSNADDMLFLMSQAGYKPVIEYCGGTEIGGGYATGTVVQPASPATFSTPALGLDFVLMDDEGQQTDNGEVFLVPPSIGLSTELLNRDHHEVYFEDVPEGPGRKLLRRHGDQIEQLGAGYYRAHGRADDTMNLGGIKVSSAEIERVLGVVAGVVETAAVAVPDEGGGPGKLVIYAVCGPEVAKDKESLISTMQSEIKSRLNPLFKIHDLVIADSLPRTASNKVMHRQLRADYVQRG
jgi:acetyl-CoA synthetase